MKSLLLTCLLPLTLVYGCISRNNKKDNPVKPPIDTLVKDSLLSKVGDDCVFDTSTYKFTTEKLLAYQKDIRFTWDDLEKEALVKLNEQDSLRLHIGGCYHFTWSVIFTTDSAAFNNNEYLLNKAVWLAKTFMGNGFDEKFSHCISNRLFTIDSSRKDMKMLLIVDTATAITNKVCEPVLFERSGSRTIINIEGAEN